MKIPKEIQDLMPERKDWNQVTGREGKIAVDGFNAALTEVEAVLPQMLALAQAETEKAYGGCRKCYGKGYATVRQEWTGRNTHIVDETPKPCSCERGKQFAEVIALAEKRGAEGEQKRINKLLNSF